MTNYERRIAYVGARLEGYDSAGQRAAIMRRLAKELFVSERTVRRWWMKYRINKNGHGDQNCNG